MTKIKNVVIYNDIMYECGVPYHAKKLNPKLLTAKYLAPEKISDLKDKEKYQIFVLHGFTRNHHRNKRIQKKWRKRYHYTQFLLVDKEEFNSLGLDFDGDTCTVAYKEVYLE